MLGQDQEVPAATVYGPHNRLKVVIDRQRWLRGEGSDRSLLLREGDGKMCCLGFVCRAVGMGEADIVNQGAPNERSVAPLWARMLPGLLGGGELGLWTGRAIDDLVYCNDDVTISPIAREQFITQYLAELGVDVTFEGADSLSTSDQCPMRDTDRSSMEPIHLKDWYEAWVREHRGTDLIFAGNSQGAPVIRHVEFVLYDLEPMLSASARPEFHMHPLVLAEHRSKSVRLPVITLGRLDLGLSLMMRYNFHCWNVSVHSSRSLAGIDVSHGRCGETDREETGRGPLRGRCWGSLYFEGFPNAWMFGPQSEDPYMFSLAPTNDYELYSFVREVVRYLEAGHHGT